MGMFSKAKPLPSTRYGYVPPPGATAYGYECNNVNCDQMRSIHEPAPRNWPVACTSCGDPMDPAFNEPWNWQSRGPWYRYMINNDPNDVYEGGLREWEFENAMFSGDISGAVKKFNDAWAWMDTGAGGAYFPDAAPRFSMIHTALGAGQLDLAASGLTQWIGVFDVFGRDYSTIDDSNSSTDRHRAFNLLTCLLAFLDAPQGKSHSSAPAIDKAARFLGGATFHAMGAQDFKFRWQTLMRTPEL